MTSLRLGSLWKNEKGISGRIELPLDLTIKGGQAYSIYLNEIKKESLESRAPDYELTINISTVK